MARLPIPGSDDGSWGKILNNYLEVSHTPSGGLKQNSVNSSAVQDGSITETKLDSALRAKLDAPIASKDSTNLSSSATNSSVAIVTNTGSKAQINSASKTYAGVMSAEDKNKLDGINAGAEINAVTSVAGKTGDVVLAAGDVGLSNVNDTSDADKPVSSATQSALDAKVDKTSLSPVATSGSYDDLQNKPVIPRITVSSAAPSSPQIGDVWIDLS